MHRVIVLQARKKRTSRSASHGAEAGRH